MDYPVILATLLILSCAGFYLGRRRAIVASGGSLRALHSLPSYYGFYIAVWAGVPALILFLVWIAAQNSVIDHLVQAALPDPLRALAPDRKALLMADIRNIATGNVVRAQPDAAVAAAAEHYKRLAELSRWMLVAAMLLLTSLGTFVAYRRIDPAMRARNAVERAARWFLIVCSTIAVFATIGIILSLLFEALRFFDRVPVGEFLFGLRWSPQEALRADQVGSSGSFGAVPVFTGTLLITAIAMLVAGPVGLFAAIYLSEYASPRVRNWVKPVMEVLAGIPTVVYGFFAALTVAPFIRDLGLSLGLDTASESALAAGLVMGVMIIPYVSSLADDVINAVPQSLRDGAYGLGATRSEAVRHVVIPAALPGIVGALLLGVSRAVGETMIVVMAAGLSAKLTANPLDNVTTVTVQIVTLLVGDQEFDSAKTLSAFALGLVLFVVTLGLNVIALRVVQKYREKYD
ncbi:MAG: phosphate ABC transporter permease subunit PstC [Candidatus Odyssella sp.]|nr:phosphate ABC transporter permease subunit PstC [Candidatus Odyssella sp.]